jgi:hypothetical protein
MKITRLNENIGGKENKDIKDTENQNQKRKTMAIKKKMKLQMNIEKRMTVKN